MNKLHKKLHKNQRVLISNTSKSIHRGKSGKIISISRSVFPVNSMYYTPDVCKILLDDGGLSNIIYKNLELEPTKTPAPEPEPETTETARYLIVCINSSTVSNTNSTLEQANKIALSLAEKHKKTYIVCKEISHTKPQIAYVLVSDYD